MLRGYVREIPGLSAARQRAMLVAAGIPDRDHSPIYTEGRRTFPAERLALLKSFRRPGEVLIVARLAVLATSRRDLEQLLADLAAKEVLILEAESGRGSGGAVGAINLAQMVIEACNFWSNRNRIFSDPAAAAAVCRDGGKATARRRRRQRLPKNLALEYWRDRALSNLEALGKINADPAYEVPWTESTAYRVLGPRGAFAGRRGKRRPAG